MENKTVLINRTRINAVLHTNNCKTTFAHPDVNEIVFCFSYNFFRETDILNFNVARFAYNFFYD